jgi:probable F420-dependent oxidoreductase
MGFIAARTSRIKLCAYVIVLGYYHPLQIAKTFGTVDRLSGGRLILGVGVGSLQPEFELLGVDFEGRGRRADDTLKALRASLGKKEPVYDGEFYRYNGFIVDPHAVQKRVPIWVGGRTKRSLRRAVELADGWAPFRLTLEELEPMLSSVEVPSGFELVLAPEPPLDPAGRADEAAQTVERYRSIGATMLNLRFEHSSLEHYLEQLEAMAKLL